MNYKPDNRIPWLFTDFDNIKDFPWLFKKFPDFSLTLKNVRFSLTFPWPWQPCFLFINFFLLHVPWHRSATLNEFSVWIGHHWRTNFISVFLDAAFWYLLALLTSVAKLWNCCLLWGGSESCRLVAWPSSPSPWSPGDFGVFPPGHETALKSADDDEDEDDDEGFLPKTGDGQAGLWDR